MKEIVKVDATLELCLKRKFEFIELPIEFKELNFPSVWALLLLNSG